MTQFKLYDYYRSSASYRVRIALHYKSVPFEIEHIDLLAGEQKSDAYKKHNPQGLVPTLVDGDFELGQSLAILSYIADRYPDPSLMLGSSQDLAYIKQMALLVACEIHPLNNPKVWKAYVGAKLGADEQQMQDWFAHWITEGFTAYEALLEKQGRMGKFTCGNTPSVADVCLIPQVYNARRFHVDLSAFPKICAIEKNCIVLDPFIKAAPESHPYAPDDLEPIHGAHSPL
ncbi:MAG: maleylacetoacetate isomerase [Rhodospirillales bacterium]|nr:maleylacetoacetate isomerase [Rhodospirillales bacterium]MCB9996203.1 maleylacetoacetate isomerase [Rhodospirillales bacterium]